MITQPVSPRHPATVEELLPWAQKEVIPLLMQLREAVNLLITNRINDLNSLTSAIGVGVGNSEQRANKGQPSGYAPLDATGKVPASFIP